MKNSSFSAKKRLGLYIHVPFCRAKCAYCDFYSIPGGDKELAKKYVDAVISHMKSYRASCEPYAVDSVFIGGGTPTALPRFQLLRLVWKIKRIFSLTKNCEFSIEANPATVDLTTLRLLHFLGVNRISFGLQSANDEELKSLSRIHSRKQFEESFLLARKAHFQNINVDLMFGIPGQTKESLYNSLRYVLHLKPEHISLYNLRVEPDTPFGKMQQEGTLALLDEDTEADMYLSSVRYLAKNGYPQYEISNFARKGYECQHNLKYWNCDEYLGFGTAAHSFFEGNRFSIVSDLSRYISGTLPINSGVSILNSKETILSRQCIGEYVMLRLRLAAGIDSREFRKRFGRDFDEMYGKKLDKYVSMGYAIHIGDRYALTPKGFFVSNAILSDVLEFDDLCSLSFQGST